MSGVDAAVQKPLVTVTDRAAQELQRLYEKDHPEGDGVRLGVKGGGCSGLSYVLDFSTQREGDHVIEHGGMRFYLDRKSAIYLKGVELDYKEGLKGKGFTFRNPNASSSCGCGESFSV
jgi:iron-sulfur cluster assembly protein